MWVPVLFCTLLGVRYANAQDNEVYADGQVFCDAAKSTTPSSGTVKLYESDPVSDDEARGDQAETSLEGKNGRFAVDGTMMDGLFEKYVEPYLLVKGVCDGRELQENYYLPCTWHGAYNDISVILDGKDDNEVCQ